VIQNIYGKNEACVPFSFITLIIQNVALKIGPLACKRNTCIVRRTCYEVSQYKQHRVKVKFSCYRPEEALGDPVD
jgi:hypothetical protein